MTIPLENQLNTVLMTVFGNEIYPIVHPDIIGDVDSVTNMFAIWSIVGGPSFNTLAGDAGISRVRVQVSIYTPDYTEMKTAQRSVNTVMQTANDLFDANFNSFEIEGALSNVSATVPQEGLEEDTRRFFCHMEFYIWSQD